MGFWDIFKTTEEHQFSNQIHQKLDKLFPDADKIAKHSYPGIEFWSSLYRDKLPKSVTRKRKQRNEGKSGKDKRTKTTT